MASNSGANRGAIIAAFLLSAVGLAGVATYVMQTPQAQRVPDAMRRQSNTETPNQPDAPVAEKMQKVRFVKLNGEKLELSAPVEIPISKGPALYSTNETIQALGLTEIRCLGIDIDHGVATLSMNPAVESGFGSMAESEFIEALSKNLGQFENIDSFRLTVEGTTIESLGHFEIENPTKVIRPSGTPSESSLPKKTSP
jgi:hypothetical protein